MTGTTAPLCRPFRAAAAAAILGAACANGAFSAGFSTRAAARSATSVRAEGADISHLESSSTPTARRKQETPPLSPLRMTDEPRADDPRREFEMAVGKAVDTLRTDYPDMLTVSPDFSIYHDDLETVDPSGVKLHGIRGYKTSFRFLHAFINFIYCPEDSGLTFRLVYDCARQHIRVSWNAELVPKKIYGGTRNIQHVDGISVYEMDKASGLITKHMIDSLVLNDTPVRPVNGIFNAIENLGRVDPEGSPVLGMELEEQKQQNPFAVEFRGADIFSTLLSSSPEKTSLFSVSDSAGGEEQQEGGLFDQEAYDRKNSSRLKFGLKPLTVPEFEKIQIQVRKMEVAQRQKAAAQAAANASATQLADEKEKKKGLFSKVFASMMEDTCESNWDCERPKVCCDLGIKKMCCASGAKIFNGMPGQQYERRLIPVPAGGGGGGGGDDGSIQPRTF